MKVSQNFTYVVYGVTGPTLIPWILIQNILKDLTNIKNVVRYKKLHIIIANSTVHYQKPHAKRVLHVIFF